MRRSPLYTLLWHVFGTVTCRIRTGHAEEVAARLAAATDGWAA